MNTYKFAQFTQLVLATLCLGACGGSGSGSGPVADDVSASAPVEEGETLADAASPAESISLTITGPAGPAGSERLETADESIALQGIAESSGEITNVTWNSDRAGQGSATGGESWETGDIPLDLGENSITITAQDSSGATAAQTVVVKRDSGTPHSVTLAWEAPTDRLDGSTLSNLAGYRIQYGLMSETYDYEVDIPNPGVLSYVIENLEPGTWYFAASAYDANNLESRLTDEVSAYLP